MKHNRIIKTISIIGLAALISMLIFTSPMEIGPFGVLLFFTTLYISLFGITSAIVGIFCHMAFRRETMRGKDYLYSAVMAFGPIMVLMARAFNAITSWTIALIFVFLVLAEFLVYKRI